MGSGFLPILLFFCYFCLFCFVYISERDSGIWGDVVALSQPRGNWGPALKKHRDDEEPREATKTTVSTSVEKGAI
jgi:hypothetical protein